MQEKMEEKMQEKIIEKIVEKEANLFYRHYIKFKEYFFSLSIGQKKLVYGFVIFVFLGFIYLFFHLPPSSFPTGKIFTINSGESLNEITNNLYEKGAIKSQLVFRSHVIVLGGEKKVMAGDYLLDKREGPANLAYRFVKGKFHLDPKRITIPEGWTIFDISDYLSKNLINFNQKSFILLSRPKEGYLFPDTYFVSPTTKAEDVINKMLKTFDEKVPTVPGYATTTNKISDVIIMASILEREAMTTETRRMISDILWRRLKIGLPLQVDASFVYVNGKNTFELTLDDLKINNPYNTYLYRGLPPTPIGSPGLDSIFAALNPIKNNYLYFLSDREGNMHYAKTFEEHKKNKQKYLK